MGFLLFGACLMLVFGGVRGESSEGISVHFVISAKDLPLTGTLDSLPDSYVEVTYFRSPDQAPDYFTAKTEVIQESVNPEFPEIFQIFYFAGHKQKLQFIVKDHNKAMSDETLGHVMVNLVDIVKAPGLKLDSPIIGKRKKNGKLSIAAMLYKNTTDDTDPRLLDSTRKPLKLRRVVQVAD